MLVTLVHGHEHFVNAVEFAAAHVSSLRRRDGACVLGVKHALRQCMMQAPSPGTGACACHTVWYYRMSQCRWCCCSTAASVTSAAASAASVLEW
jgi:hypothetical protein